MSHALIERLGAMISGVKRVVAFTGAGVSAESGIPTYRGEGGVWNKYNPDIYASIDYFEKDPSYYWRFFSEVRLALLKTIKPNAAHEALAQLERAGKLSSIITQNIDGLHQDAGSRKVIELHGNTRDIYCTVCRLDYAFETLCDILDRNNPPLCPSCGGVLRPDIVFFGEGLPNRALAEASSEMQACDLVLAIGSTLSVQPAAGFPLIARERGAKFVIINKGPTVLDDYADLVIDGSAGDVLSKALISAKIK